VSSKVAAAEKTFPVVEIFGPTIQGEGWVAGLPTYFIRFGLCDYRCSWCDSLYAVLPEEVRKNATRLTAKQIDRVLAEPLQARWITFSGGNPALHDLGPLITLLRRKRLKIAVETQGSRWTPWLKRVDHLTISPKPPSSGEIGKKQDAQVKGFMRQVAGSMSPGEASLKIVVFDRDDLAWAIETAERYGFLPFFISVGTDSLGAEPLEATAERYREVCELVATDGSAAAKRARVLPQLHVIAWGHRRGV
jgi:7-carboxy-7-deazaguanine synthase